MKLKSIILSFFLLGFALALQAQDSDKLFNKFSNNKEITTVYISKYILRLAPDMSMDMNGANIGSLMNKIDKLEIYTTEKPSVAAMMKKEADVLMKNKVYENMMTVREGDELVDFLVVPNGDKISELVMVVSEPNDCTIMRIVGNFTMEDIQKVMADKESGKKK